MRRVDTHAATAGARFTHLPNHDPRCKLAQQAPADSGLRSVLSASVLCVVAAAALLAVPASAASPDNALPPLDGSVLSIAWAIPFAGLLLSIAFVPLVASRFWHDHYGKVAAAWALGLLIPFAYVYGTGEALHHVAHAVLLEYLPFVIVLFALYTIAGGICFRGAWVGTPAVNTGLLAVGATLASIMGTTGASMLLIRPLLTANETRRHKVHTVVFFILLVGNVGGALTPLGDPPLFIGFLKGVDFFWTTQALARPTLFTALTLLAAFYLFDRWMHSRESEAPPSHPGEKFEIEGGWNLLLIAGVIAAILICGKWDPGVVFTVFGTPVDLSNVVRDVTLVVLALVSLKLTPAAIREHNVFHWAPILEVAKLFAGIFVTIFPVLAILQAGSAGALAWVGSLVYSPHGTPIDSRVFWITGVLSAFLDNAPTYLVFFNLAGGDAAELMGPRASTLAAISMGAVYFGALTYIGNAPNFMIKAIAEDRGVAMPSFFGYLAYAALVMLPLLAAVGWLFL